MIRERLTESITLFISEADLFLFDSLAEELGTSRSEIIRGLTRLGEKYLQTHTEQSIAPEALQIFAAYHAVIDGSQN